MGEAFITRRGGSSAKVYAVIGVTYPTGSTCTCTNGSKTLTAKDTTGKALFFIPSAGTWAVTAVKGSKSTSKTVSITAEGQVETVELNFEIVLFDGSTGTVASGYSWLGHDILHDNSYGYYIVFYGYGGDTAGNISPMIDVSNYSTLKIKACLYGDAMAGTGYGAIGLYKTLPDWAAASVAPIAGIQIGIGQSSQPKGLSAAQEYTVDISALSGEYYFAGVSKGWNPAALQVELS